MEMTRQGNESILRCIITMELELEIVGQTLNWDRCRVFENYLGLVAGGRGGRQGEGALRVPRGVVGGGGDAEDAFGGGWEWRGQGGCWGWGWLKFVCL